MSSPATSSASTTTRCSSTSATSPKGSSRRTSCRFASRSIPSDEVSLGEEVDALVLTKEDQDGRLILSKKRARFEKAWRRIEAAAESGRAGRGRRDRGRQGRSDHRPRRARLPARVAGRHPPRPEPRRVHGPDDRVQGDRAQPLAQQRRAVPPRGARGAAQGGPRAHPRPAAARPGRGGHDLEHRRFRCFCRPRWDRRSDPYLRTFVVARQPSLRDPNDRRQGHGQGARHRSPAPADLPRASSRPRRTRGSGSSTPTTSATSSRARSPRWSRSARSSRSSTASRVWSTSPSSPSTTSRTRARSSSRATRYGSRSSRSTPSGGGCRCRSSGSRARCCRSGRSRRRSTARRGDLDNVPELGLSEDVFAGEDGAALAMPPSRSRRVRVDSIADGVEPASDVERRRRMSSVGVGCRASASVWKRPSRLSMRPSRMSRRPCRMWMRPSRLWSAVPDVEASRRMWRRRRRMWMRRRGLEPRGGMLEPDCDASESSRAGRIESQPEA